MASSPELVSIKEKINKQIDAALDERYSKDTKPDHVPTRRKLLQNRFKFKNTEEAAKVQKKLKKKEKKEQKKQAKELKGMSEEQRLRYL